MTPRRRVPALLAVGAALLALWSWQRGEPEAVAAQAPPEAPQRVAGVEQTPPPAPAASATPGAPLSALGQAQRREELALWQGRLERARMTLDGYRIAAQYPHESRPIDEHPDQVRPFEPISEDRALRMPGGGATQGVHLKSTQERVFASGSESSRVTLKLLDDNGRTLPLKVTRAVQKEVTPPGRTAGTVEFPMPINHNDGLLSAVMQPSTQGFAAFAGTVRLELALDYGGQPGFIYFDLHYSPETAATWLPGVREASSSAGIEFFLKAQVLVPGRYVVSARVDDAQGQPVALALFNAEVAAGLAEFRLPVFGKLLRDKQPAFPLQLRDVEAFLLKPDAFPDRVMLPRRAGVLHQSKSYTLSTFSEAEWSSEERDRYVTELGKDVAVAEQKVKALGP